MIGGPPIFTPSFVAAPMPAYPAAPRPRPQPRPRPRPRPRPPASPARASVPSRGFTARGVAPEPRHERVSIPRPEELGVGLGATPQPVDLARVWARLKAMGAVGFEVNRFGQGWKFVCLLPGTDSDRPRRIEAKADTEAEAIRSGLARAEQAHAVLAARK